MAAVIHQHGGPESIGYEEFPRPTPGPGEALLRVRATSINRLNHWARSGPSVKIIPRPIALAKRLKIAVSKLATSDPVDADARNQGMKRLSQILNPALFTVDGPYEFDPALQLPVLPSLAPLRLLAALDTGSDDYHYLLTKLRRQRNRVADSLLQACELVDMLNAH